MVRYGPVSTYVGWYAGSRPKQDRWIDYEPVWLGAITHHATLAATTVGWLLFG
jgi:hypothetical protein